MVETKTEETKQETMSREEAAAVIQSMLATAQKAPDFATQVVDSGTTGGNPMIAKKTDAGFIYLYDVETGMKTAVNSNLVAQIVNVMLPNGQRRFSATKPAKEPFKGSVKCLLHPSQPDRKRFDELGFPTCKKENITSAHQLNLHMQRRHPSAWKTLEEEKVEKRRDEDRKFQQAMLEALTKQAKATK